VVRKFCGTGRCRPEGCAECELGQARCAPEGSAVETCVDGRFLRARTCPGGCDAGECHVVVEPVCEPLAACGGESAGNWIVQASCSGIELDRASWSVFNTSEHPGCQESLLRAQRHAFGEVDLGAAGRVDLQVLVSRELEVEFSGECIDAPAPTASECAAQAERWTKRSGYTATCMDRGTHCACLVSTAPEPEAISAARIADRLAHGQYCVNDGGLRVRTNDDASALSVLTLAKAPERVSCDSFGGRGLHHVLVLSSGDAALDAQVKQLIESTGNQVTLGLQFFELPYDLDYSPYDVVYFQANANSTGGDMPLLAQSRLVEWVRCGGGLLTVEWTHWKVQQQQLSRLSTILPATAATADPGDARAIVYTAAIPDAVVQRDLPESFEFSADDFQGTELPLRAQTGASVFYRGAQGDGVLGWAYQQGRVASLSTVAGSLELNDPNYRRIWSPRFPL